MNKRFDAIVRGRVQLVMYRDFAQRKARGLRITGHVQNRKDGTVEVVAEGSEKNLQDYVEKLRKGPLLARVDAVDLEWVPPQGLFKKFDILYE